eukprot:CAMPEP_0183333372 /NCGR_PEP_ID=MMETSP0164_2-20130417/2286_1 /TAXON_ID=221442 /ORGANISM="Coccolithus pelagicus ssp braarudi, Strain PLY182g" /LENGTH=266 /DNA_ID=CAMNT_0025502283 /DNA_START=43 /DNA_END=843 /DNA_ORIENTATION=+
MSMGGLKRRRGGAEPKEIPQWKLDMMAAEAGSSAPPAAARAPRQSDEHGVTANKEKGAGNRAAAAAASESIGEGASSPAERAPRDLPPDDDDDDDDVDLSNYKLDDEDDDEGGGEGAASSTGDPQYTREELLLMREAADTAGRSRKTFFVDDMARSEEKSLGRERASDRKKARSAASQFGLAFDPAKQLTRKRVAGLLMDLSAPMAAVVRAQLAELASVGAQALTEASVRPPTLSPALSSPLACHLSFSHISAAATPICVLVCLYE